MSISTFLRDDLCGSPGTAGHLGAPSGTQLDIVNRRAERDVPQRKRVAYENVRIRTCNNGHPHFQAHRLKNVSTLTVGIAQQRDKRRTVWIVFHRFHFGGNADLVTPEIDQAIMLLISASPMANRQLAVIVAAVDTVLRLQKRLVRLVSRYFLLVVNDCREAKRGRRCSESLKCHYTFFPSSIIFSPSRSVTYAFFLSARYPLNLPR